MGILTHIRKGNISQEMQSQVKSFILRRKKSFEDYIRSEESIEKYITNTLEQIDRETPSADTSYWSIKFITQNQENFENYLTGEKSAKTMSVCLWIKSKLKIWPKTSK